MTLFPVKENGLVDSYSTETKRFETWLITEVIAGGKKIRAEAKNGKQVVLSSSKISKNFITFLPNTSFDAFERSLDDIRGTLTEDDLELLWESLKPEGDEATAEHSLQDLAAELWGETSEPVHLSALARALLDDENGRFVWQKGNFQVLGEERLKQLELEKERQERERIEREKPLKLAQNWIDLIRRPIQDSPPEEVRDLMQALCEYAAFPESRIDRKSLEFQALCQWQGGEFRSGDATRLYCRLRLDQEPEASFAERYWDALALHDDFEDVVLEDMDRVRKESENLDENREDLRDLASFSIDDETTRDYDDALSWDAERLYVHIADAASMLSEDSPLFREAFRRSVTLYWPDRKFPMFPQKLSEGIWSLKRGEDRRAISFVFFREEEGYSLEKIVPSWVRIRENLSYSEVEEKRGTAFSPLDEQGYAHLSSWVERQMAARKVFHRDIPEVIVKVAEDGRISVKAIDKQSFARSLVSELMLLTGTEAAAWAKDKISDMVYRVQDRLTDGFRTKAAYSLVADEHTAMGGLYCQVTSPMRRAVDLCNQWQLLAALGLRDPLDNIRLQRLVMQMQQRIARARMIEETVGKYWKIRYHLQEGCKRLPALVLRRGRIVLLESGLDMRLDAPDNAARVGANLDVDVDIADAERFKVIATLSE